MSSSIAGPRPESLRELSTWFQEKSHLELGDGIVVDVWEEAVLPGAVSYDASLVKRVVSDVVRLAAIDGVKNVMGATPGETALRAVHTIRRWLSTTPDPAVALERARAELFDPKLQVAMRNPTAAAGVVDFNLATGEFTFTVAGDCEAWVRIGETWSRVLGFDMLTAEGRELYDRRRASIRYTPSGWWPIQETELAPLKLWRNPAIGWTEKLSLDTLTVSGVDEVIMSSDGARLDPEKCANLEEWLSTGIQRFPTPDWEHPSPHGDLAVLRMKRPQ